MIRIYFRRTANIHGTAHHACQVFFVTSKGGRQCGVLHFLETEWEDAKIALRRMGELIED